MANDVRLIVGGKRYGGWKSVRISQSMESVAGSFELGVSDRWAEQSEPWPIVEEDNCRIEINGTPIIDGYVDRRSIGLSEGDRSLTVSGRDRAAALVDNSAVMKSWSFKNVDALDVARKICEPFNVPVSLQPGLKLPKVQAKVAISPGEDAFGVLQKVVGAAGALVVSDGAGGILLTRTGSKRAGRLVQGDNVKNASVEYDGADRFHKYIVVTQIPGTDKASGKATKVRAEAIDEGVRRTDRVLLVQSETGVNNEFAKRRADWEARKRAAKAEQVSITVVGWLQPDGKLWTFNTLAEVHVPAIGVNGTMLISQVEYDLGPGGETATLSLMRPDAFSPEPKAVVRKGGAGTLWKEIAKGAK